MDGEAWDTHTQTVRLTAGKAPWFFQRVRHWRNANIEGDTLGSASEENRLYLADLHSHITTVPVLHHSFCKLFVASLLIICIFAAFRRFERDLKPGRTRVLVLWHVFTLTITAIAIGALFDRLGLTMAMVAACIACLKDPWDALGVLILSTLASRGWTTTAIWLTAAYFAWTQEDWEDLPDFETFLAKLQRFRIKRKRGSETGEDRGCLICWSSNKKSPPLQLTCHQTHRICRRCLVRLFRSGRHRCPLCDKTLYRGLFQGYETTLLRIFIKGGVMTTFAFCLFTIALQVCKGYYFSTAKYIFSACVYLWLVHGFPEAVHEERNDLGEMPIDLLWVSAALTILPMLFAAWRLRTWDQVTLWDGAVLEGVQSWDTYVVSRPLYGPASSGQTPGLGLG